LGKSERTTNFYIVLKNSNLKDNIMIIGLAGLGTGVGQKTIANHLKVKHNFFISSISEPSKVIAESFFGYDPSGNNDSLPNEIRRIGNLEDPNMWVYYALDFARRRKRGLYLESMKISFLFYYNIIGIKEDLKEMGAEEYVGEENIVLTDIQNINEAYSIIDLGGKVFTIEREGFSKLEEMNGNFQNIENNGTIEDLYIITDSIVLQ